MRIVVFFDLPTLTAADRRNYRKFRKMLIKNGFIMMQESVYSKLALNATAAATISDKLRSDVPKKGLVQVLKVTEHQFSRIELLAGEMSSEYLSSTDRMVIL